MTYSRHSNMRKIIMKFNAKRFLKRQLPVCACILFLTLCGLFLWIYHIPGVSGFDMEANISDQQIEELLALAPVRRGASFRAVPCPAFEIHVTFEDKFYELIVGKNGCICVNGFSFYDSNDKETFWADSGELFSALYEYHISAGGEPIP